MLEHVSKHRQEIELDMNRAIKQAYGSKRSFMMLMKLVPFVEESAPPELALFIDKIVPEPFRKEPYIIGKISKDRRN